MNMKKFIISITIVGILLFSAVGAGMLLLQNANEEQPITSNANEVIFSSDEMSTNEESILPLNSEVEDVLFHANFEENPWDGAFASNNGWLDSLYGSALSGDHWAYSWAAGDTLTTPVISLTDTPTLSFYIMAESSTHPMDLNVTVNDNLVFQEEGYTYKDYQQIIVDLSSFANTDVIINFTGGTSDFYGQCLEDVKVTSNDFPIANDDYAETDEDTSVIINVSENDTDADGTLNFSSVTTFPASHGIVDANPNGTVTYTPTSDFYGIDTFEYTIKDDDGAISNQAMVTVTVNEVEEQNEPPIAINDTAYTNDYSTLFINVSENDIDENLDISSIMIIDKPVYGKAIPNQNGTVTYMPDSSFNGEDSFTYTINDTDDETSNEATVTISVPIDDLPEIEIEKTVWNETSESWDDRVIVYQGETLLFNVKVCNPYDYYEIHWSGNIIDEFPCCLTYNENSTENLTLHQQQGETIDWENKIVDWKICNSEFLLPGECLNFTYTATATCDCPCQDCMDHFTCNTVTASPDGLRHTIIKNASHHFFIANTDKGYADGLPLNVSDKACIKCKEQPELSIAKEVKIDCDGDYNDDGVTITLDEEDRWVTFRLIVSGNGTYDSVTVKDVVPDGLSFDYYWSVSQEWPLPDQSGNILTWELDVPDEEWTRIIKFRANVDEGFCDFVTNHANVTGLFTDDAGQHKIVLSDTAWVDVECEEPGPGPGPGPEGDGVLLVDKRVKPDCMDLLLDDSTSFGFGDFDYVSYVVDVMINESFVDSVVENLVVRDSLPQLSDGLSFNDSCDCAKVWVNRSSDDHWMLYDGEVVQSFSDDFVFWNFTDGDFYAGDQVRVTYCADVVDCGVFVNTVNVSGSLCSYSGGCGDDVFAIDNASVDVVCGPGLSVSKDVSLDGNVWMDDVDSFVGDMVWFRITVENSGYEELVTVSVLDDLPGFLEFNEVISDGGADLNLSNDTDGFELKWVFENLSQGEVVELVFTADVVGINDDEECNLVVVNSCIPDLSVSDTACVSVGDGLFVDKKVWNDDEWVEHVSVLPGESVLWNVTIGFSSVSDTSLVFNPEWVNDSLPDGLSYVNDSAVLFGVDSVAEPEVVDGVLMWTLPEVLLQHGDWFSIVFETVVAGNVSSGSELVNMVNVTGLICNHTWVTETDSASIIIETCSDSFITCEKLVRKDNGQWKNTIDEVIGETVEFKISITNNGTGDMNNINIEDNLPAELTYKTGTSEIYFNGSYYDCDDPITIEDSTLIWEQIERNLPNENAEDAIRYVHVGETITLHFEATTEQAGLAINHADINAKMCQNAIHVTCSDTATVNISIEDLVASADIESSAPYFIDEQIQFSGSASGGQSPYTYFWDLDDDGVFDDSTLQNPTETWTSTGTNTVSLKVVDDRGMNDTDSVTFSISKRTPKLSCQGTINFQDVKPRETITETITIQNVGDSGSKLDWSIQDDDITWGTWTFVPSSGTDLTPEDGSVTVDISIVVPRNRNDEFDDSITIVNDDDPSDTCEIPVSITTPYNDQHPILSFLERFIDHFPILDWIVETIFS